MKRQQPVRPNEPQQHHHHHHITADRSNSEQACANEAVMSFGQPSLSTATSASAATTTAESSTTQHPFPSVALPQQPSALPPPSFPATATNPSSFLFASFLGVANPLELNNIGVSFSQSLRNDEALVILQHALNEQASCERQSEISLSSLVSLAGLGLTLIGLPALATTMTAAAVNVSKIPNIYSAPCDGHCSLLSTQADDDMQSSPSNYFSVYNQLFAFKDLKSESLSWTHRTCLPPAVILYNMGLTYHRRALKGIRNENYARALHLYSLSIRIIEESISCGLFVSDFSLLQLALYNNMGFINSHFFNEDEAMVCAGRLLSTFASMDCSRLLSKDEYVFYYMNLLFLLNRNPKFAPAA